MDLNSLNRFLTAQEHAYDIALAEIRRGRKRTHWIWYIFPQLRSLGKSERSYFYGIADIEEAKAYLDHPILGSRLIEISETLLHIQGKSAQDIFGGIDSMKLHSSMTLFAVVGGDGSVFYKVIDRYFDGKMDENTLKILYNN